MSYQATVFNVMIASPGDVTAEREQARSVIHEWNAIHSHTRRIVLLPLGWETHSSPQMGAGPQEIINEQVLAKADLVVGVFWTRIGTKTDDYDSGTVEEIERHIESGKPAMLYFSNSPVQPGSVDQKQYKRLDTFKTSCRKRGLYEEFSGAGNFRSAFNRHLQLKLNEHPLFMASNGASVIKPEVVVAEQQTVELSEEAVTLLRAARADENGVIIHVRFMDGTSIQTNGQELIPSRERRVVVAWESALHEIVALGLVNDTGNKGEIYSLTAEGYRIADLF